MDEITVIDIDGEPHVELHGAFAATYRRLESVFNGVDPAPCIKPERGHFFGTLQEYKLNWLTPKVMHAALLNGELRGKAVSSTGSAWNVPAWVWAAESRLWGYWLIQRLTISPLYPAFAIYDGRQVFIQQDQLHRWLTDLHPAQCVAEPTMPQPVDLAARPSPAQFAPPADKTWIGLTEASTWIAFRFSMDANQLIDLETAEEIALLAQRQFETAAEGLEALLGAAGGMNPKLKLVGEYHANYVNADNGAVVAEIDPKALIQFSKPDWQRDGLTFNASARRAYGVHENHLSGSRGDGYRYVMVDREQLLAAFPPPVGLEPPIPAIVPMSNDEIESWCCEWLAGGHDNVARSSGTDKAWKAFKGLERAQHLSRDDVFRPAFTRAKTKAKQ